MFKKIFSLIFIMILSVSMFACNETSVTVNEDDVLSNATNEVSDKTGYTFHRLKKATVTYDGETKTYNVSWENGSCEFQSYMNFFTYPTETYKGSLNKDTNTFYLTWLREEGNMEMPVFEYDDNQRITKVYNEDDPTESWGVTYDENNVPTIDGSAFFEYDVNSRTITKGGSIGMSNGKEVKRYVQYSLDSIGNIKKLTEPIYTRNENGVFVKTEETSNQTYTYNENGDLIKYEAPNDEGLIIEFEYYNETINHLWERIIPIHYIEVFDIYLLPFFWYL